MNFVMFLCASLFTNEERQAYNGGFLTDQRGKYVVMYDVQADLSENEDLSLVIRDFFKEEPMVLTEEKRLSVNGAIHLNHHVVMGNYVAGDVLYRLVFEKTAEGFRYWFTDLAYRPYIKDRYGKVTKASVAPIPLEKEFGELNKGAWMRQRRAAYEAIRQESERWGRHLKSAGRAKTIEIP